MYGTHFCVLFTANCIGISHIFHVVKSDAARIYFYNKLGWHVLVGAPFNFSAYDADNDEPRKKWKRPRSGGQADAYPYTFNDLKTHILSAQLIQQEKRDTEITRASPYAVTRRWVSNGNAVSWGDHQLVIIIPFTSRKSAGVTCVYNVEMFNIENGYELL